MLALRLCEGIQFRAYEERFQMAFPENISGMPCVLKKRPAHPKERRLTFYKGRISSFQHFDRKNLMGLALIHKRTGQI